MFFFVLFLSALRPIWWTLVYGCLYTTQSYESFGPPASFAASFLMSGFLSHLNDDLVCCLPICLVIFCSTHTTFYSKCCKIALCFTSRLSSKLWKLTPKQSRWIMFGRAVLLNVSNIWWGNNQHWCTWYLHVHILLAITEIPDLLLCLCTHRSASITCRQSILTKTH